MSHSKEESEDARKEREHKERIRKLLVRDEEHFPMLRGCKQKNVYFTSDEEDKMEHGKNHFISCEYLHPTHTCLSFGSTLWLKVFSGAFLMYAPIHLIPVLVYKRKQLFKDPISVITGFMKNATRSALFLAVFNSLLVSVMCVTGRLRQKHGLLNVYLSGFLAGTSLFFEPKSRRAEIAIYSVVEVGEAVKNYIMEKQLVSTKKFNQALILMFAFSMSTLMYMFEHKPKLLKSSIAGLIRQIVGVN